MKNEEELSLEEQVERIRKKRARRFDNTKVRMALNFLFLIFAVVGLCMYFFGSVLIAQIVLLPGPDVAVPVAENRLIAFVQEPLDAACGTGSAAAVDKNLFAHGSILLYILKIDHTS